MKMVRILSFKFAKNIIPRNIFFYNKINLLTTIKKYKFQQKQKNKKKKKLIQ